MKAPAAEDCDCKQVSDDALISSIQRALCLHRCYVPVFIERLEFSPLNPSCSEG